jgi:outer membrane protein TolC
MTGINIPLINSNHHPVKAANYAVQQEKEDCEITRNSLIQEVEAAYIHYINTLVDWKNFTMNMEEILSEAEHVAQQAQQYETLKPDDVLEMELMIIDTRKLLAKKRCQFAHALYDLYYTIGLEDYTQLLSTNKK